MVARSATRVAVTTRAAMRQAVRVTPLLHTRFQAGRVASAQGSRVDTRGGSGIAARTHTTAKPGAWQRLFALGVSGLFAREGRARARKAERVASALTSHRRSCMGTGGVATQASHRSKGVPTGV